LASNLHGLVHKARCKAEEGKNAARL
jgi:hypothetical protein